MKIAIRFINIEVQIQLLHSNKNVDFMKLREDYAFFR